MDSYFLWLYTLVGFKLVFVDFEFEPAVTKTYEPCVLVQCDGSLCRKL